MIQLCQDLKGEKGKDIVYKYEAKCWTDDFQKWFRVKNGLAEDALVMPLDPDVLRKALYEFATTDVIGKSLRSDFKIGFNDDKLIFMQIDTKS